MDYKYGWYWTQEDNIKIQALRDASLSGDHLADAMFAQGIRLHWMCRDCAEDMVFATSYPQIILPCQHCME